MDRYLAERQLKIGAVHVAIAHHRGTALNMDACYHHRLGSYLSHTIDQRLCLVARHAIGMIRLVGEQTRLGVVGIGHIGHAHHLAHGLYSGLAHAVVELTLVAHHRVHKHQSTLLGLLAAEL